MRPVTGATLRAGLAALALGILVPARADAAPPPAEAPAPAEGAPHQVPLQDFSEPVLESLRTALEAYEEVRSALATDRMDGVPAAATRLATAFRAALEGGGARLARPTRGVLEEAALLAESMAEAEDLEAARTAFGGVSRPVLLLAGSDVRLAAGRHVFVCPMAPTFGKWIQPAEVLENPYMGSAMSACGSPADWSVPAPPVEAARPAAEEADVRGAKEETGAEPEFKPGIPGLRMVDVRDHKFLWREIEELQLWERGDRISVAEYRSKVVEKTAHFLGLGGAAADAFAAAASEAVASLREAFLRRPRTGSDEYGLEVGYSPELISSELRAAVTRVTSLLQEKPRHRLFEPECKKWLLKLAFGPREAKEAKEADQARADARRDDPGPR